MTNAENRRDQDDFSLQAKRVYERQIKPKLRPEDHGKFVVLDPATGEYELGEDELRAAMSLRLRLPNARLWLERVGYKAAHRVGFWR